MSKRARSLLVIVLLIALFALVLRMPEQSAEEMTAKVHFFTDSGGLAVLLECNGKFGMVDAGEDGDYPDGSDPRYPFRTGIVTGPGSTERIVAYLKDVGVTEDNFVFFIGTHPHSDHIGSADEIISEFKPQRVYIQQYEDSYILDADHLWDNLYVYDQMLQAAQNTGAEIIQNINSENANFTLGSDMVVEIKNYTDDYKTNFADDANDFSLGVLVKANGRSLFIGGDINNFDGDETRLIPQLGHVDVLVLGHHGCYGSNSNAYVTGLTPEMLLIPGGFGNVSAEALDNDKSLMDTILEMGEKGVPTYAIDWFAETQDAVVVELDEALRTNIPEDYACVAVTNRMQPPVYLYFSNGLPTVYDGTFDGITFRNSMWGNLGTWNQTEDSACYYEYDGSNVTGWNYIEGEWYYFGADGRLLRKR